MFHRYSNTQSEKDFRTSLLKVRNTFSQIPNSEERFSFYYTSGYNHEKLPLITQESPDEITWMHWGLVPNTIKSKTQKEEHLKTSNCIFERAERFEISWLAQQSAETKRCLVPATGFFAWREMKQWMHSANEHRDQKYHYFIELLNIYGGEDPMPFCFPGVYNRWEDSKTGESYTGFIIFTCDSEYNHFMGKITSRNNKNSERMPCIITYDDYYKWLDPNFDVEDAPSFLYAIESDNMRAYSVSQNLNKYSIDHNTPEILTYHPYKVLGDENRFNFD